MTDTPDTTTASHRGTGLGAIILAGIAGEIVFEALAFLVAPAIVGQAMQPAYLVMGLAQALFGAEIGLAGGWAGHLLAGAVLFPLGYVAFRRITGLPGWVVPGLIWAACLWFIAQGVLAPIVGRPFMLGFVTYTWASLAVHGIYMLAVAGTLQWLETRRG